MIDKVKELFEPDQDGKTNPYAMFFFLAIGGFPIVLYKGILCGFYKGEHMRASGMEALLLGNNQPFSYLFPLWGRNFVPDYIIIFSILYAMIIIMIFISIDRNKNKSNKKDGWMQFGNIKKFNKEFAYPKGAEAPSEPEEWEYEPGNMILSDRIRYDVEPKGTNTYSCALIVGATGSGKSFTYVKPNILQMNTSYVVTDPKGELTRDTGKALLDHGYNVMIFNTAEPQYSCKYNPFRYVRDEAGVVSMVNVFLENTNDPNSSGNDPFFGLAEKNFYLAICFYIYTVYKDQPEKQNFKTVYEMYQMADEPEQMGRNQAPTLSPFDELFLELAKKDPANPAIGYYNTFKKGSPKTKQAILISAGVRLWFLAVPSIANLMSEDTLHLETIGDRKTALFVIIKAEDATFNFLSAMLFTQLFETLYYVGNTLNEKSWLLTYGNCTALRSDPFIMGTPSETKAKEDLERLRNIYASAVIEADDENDEKFKTANEFGIIPWPKARLVTGKGKEKQILQEFNSVREAEIILEACKKGKIKKGSKTLTSHVRFMLDEFANIGKIPDFDKKLATFRSLRISADIIVQSVAQLKEMYEDRHGKITSNCSITISLGLNDLDDCKWFSELIGQTTVKAESINLDNSGLIPGAKGGSISDNAQSLLRPENIRAMNKDECLVIVNTQMPLRDKKYNATKHPRWKESLDSHDPATAKNEFQYRRLFYIEQREDAKVVATLPASLSQPSILNGKAAIPQQSGKKTGKPHFHNAPVGVKQEQDDNDRKINAIALGIADSMTASMIASGSPNTKENESNAIDINNLSPEQRKNLIQRVNNKEMVLDENNCLRLKTDKEKSLVSEDDGVISDAVADFF